jgi:hypothetical protein
MFTRSTQAQSPWKIICQSFTGFKSVFFRSLPTILTITVINVVIILGVVLSFGGVLNVMMFYTLLVATKQDLWIIPLSVFILLIMLIWTKSAMILTAHSRLFDCKRTYWQVLKTSLLRGVLALLAWLPIVIVFGLMFIALLMLLKFISTVVFFIIVSIVILIQLYITIKLFPLTYLILTGSSIKQAFKESIKLTRSKWWHVFLVFAILGVVGYLVGYAYNYLATASSLFSVIMQDNGGLIKFLLILLAIILYFIPIVLMCWGAVTRWLLIHDLKLRNESK